MSSPSSIKLRRSTRRKTWNSSSNPIKTTTTKPITTRTAQSSKRKKVIPKTEKENQQDDPIKDIGEGQTKSWFERRDDGCCDIDVVARWCCNKENYKAWRSRDVNKNETGELVAKELIKSGHPVKTPKDCEGAIRHLEFFFDSAYRAINHTGRAPINPKESEIMQTNIARTFPWYKVLEPVMSDRPIFQPSDPHDIRSIQDHCLGWLLRLERENEPRVNVRNEDSDAQQGSRSKPAPIAQTSQQNKRGENSGLLIIPDDGLAKSATWSSDKEEQEECSESSCDCSECSPSPSNSKSPKKRRRTETTSIQSDTEEILNWKQLIREYLATKLERDEVETQAIEDKSKLLDSMALVVNQITQNQVEIKKEYFKKVNDKFRNKIRSARSKMTVELIHAGVAKGKACEIAKKSLADDGLSDDEDQLDTWGK